MTIVESLAALAMLVAAAGVFVQLHLLAARHERMSDARGAASQTLANWMEQCSKIPTAELSGDRLLQIAPLESVKEQLPEIEADANVSEEEGSPSGKRVTLVLHWSAADGESQESVQLTAWRYASQIATEDSP